MWNKILIFLGIRKRKTNKYFDEKFLEVVRRNTMFVELSKVKTIDSKHGVTFKKYSQLSI